MLVVHEYADPGAFVFEYETDLILKFPWGDPRAVRAPEYGVG